MFAAARSEDEAVKVVAVLSSLMPLLVTLWVALQRADRAEHENAILRDRLEKCTCPVEAQP